MSLHDVAVQFWQEVLARPSGPLAFRFILQPVMAAGLAIRDGYRDAQANRTPYLWDILRDPIRCGPRLREGIVATTRVLVLGVCMDLTYQFIRKEGFHPVQTIGVVFVLAFLPYLIVRGPAGRIARYFLRRSENGTSFHTGP